MRDSFIDKSSIQANLTNFIICFLVKEMTFQMIHFADGNVSYCKQMYESLSSLILFVLLFLIWRQKKELTTPGRIFGIFLTYLFTLRFLYEFLKENQVAFEDNLPLNMGQWLSIPMAIAGIVILIRSFDKKKAHIKCAF